MPLQSDGTESCIDRGDTSWVLVSTILVLGMMPALAFFEAGLLRSKNTLSIITQIIGKFDIRLQKWIKIAMMQMETHTARLC